MKKVFGMTMAMLVLLTIQLKAQTAAPLRVKEYGIGLTNLNGFTLQYRWGNEKRLYRVTGSLYTGGGFSETNTRMEYSDSTRANVSRTEKQKGVPKFIDLGFGFSVIHLKPISEKFGFIYGPNFGIYGNYSRNENNYYLGNFSGGTNYTGTQIQYRTTLRPFVGIVLGASYKLNANFFLYGEIAPSLFYDFVNVNYTATASNNPNVVEKGYTRSHGFGMSGISNSGAMLTLVYRITRQ